MTPISGVTEITRSRAKKMEWEMNRARGQKIHDNLTEGGAKME
jgi:hypothetical protein